MAEARAFQHVLDAQVESRFIDANGHMNVAWYIHLLDRATWAFFATLGIDDDYRARTRCGVFAVEEHVRYLGELFEGDRLEIRTRLLAVKPRALFLQHALVDLGRDRLAASAELVGIHTHLDERRALPFPPELAAHLTSQVKPPATTAGSRAPG